jgi:hypothetical protein
VTTLETRHDGKLPRHAGTTTLQVCGSLHNCKTMHAMAINLLSRNDIDEPTLAAIFDLV